MWLFGFTKSQILPISLRAMEDTDDGFKAKDIIGQIYATWKGLSG